AFGKSVANHLKGRFVGRRPARVVEDFLPAAASPCPKNFVLAPEVSEEGSSRDFLGFSDVIQPRRIVLPKDALLKEAGFCHPVCWSLRHTALAYGRLLQSNQLHPHLIEIAATLLPCR